ncbi:Inactive dipeptidyl peptidase 10 [Operophtera brumata]|uniref:Inactive dipeptidyl peptidase 10 n=1 Tax=Operophtera brumata TaxID=104452 RepID=A0A0L7L3S5_OPEBR|nr:Inactive dipeptidyl peptidase 10 [Operophtera brumata]
MPKPEMDLYGGEGHNWKSIIFSLMVISFVIAGIVVAIYLLGYVDELLYWSGRRMRLDEFLRGDLTVNRLPTTWVSPHQLIYQADDGGLFAFNTFNNTLTVLVTNHTLRQLNVRGYQCSPNLRYVLFQHNIREVYQRTFTATYTVYDVTNDELLSSHHIPLFGEGQRSWDWQHASWLGTNGSLLLVADNEVLALPGPPARRAQLLQLTYDAVPGRVYNGVSDWLYQDGSLVLYVQYDDTAVSELKFPRISEGIGGAGASRAGFLLPALNSTLHTVFPDHITIRYPTPGSSIPKVTLWIVSVENTSSTPQKWAVKPPTTLDGMEYYLISAQWVGQDNSHVGSVWMNRAQNLTVYSSCYAPNWTCSETHSEKATDEPWLEVHQKPVYSEDGSAFLLLAAVQEGGGQYYTHIKHVDVNRQRIAVLSHGRMEVTEVLAWDQENHLVYYLGSADRPGQRHVYVVRDPSYGGGSNSVRARAEREEPRCLTCELAVWPARLHYANCSFWRAKFSPLALPTRRSFDVQLGGGSKARVQLLLPPSWREELRDAAFPVLVHVDGRPGSQQVTEEYLVDWGSYMASRNDVVYVKLDVAGSRGLSRALLRGRLGGVEVADQLAVIRYLLETFKFLDVTRVAVWGWGYGGYVTAMLLGSQQSTLKCGIAVSPITDWLYYNAAFTERTLGQPSVNYKGYVEADASQRAHHVPAHALYLVHGMADMSAPYPHALQLARALTDAGVLFRYQDYLRECLSLDPEDTKLPPPDR